ncbi:hypothetical protein GCM10010501_11580 [Streptomyces libani subsp. rufus]|nr:hypothetical protein GCM10010501_11580 [Streptomyces libani subsp. rufus]
MVGAEAAGDEEFDGVAEEFFAAVAEEGFRLGVDQADGAGAVDNDPGVRGRFQQPPEPSLGGARDATGSPGAAPARAGSGGADGLR